MLLPAHAFCLFVSSFVHLFCLFASFIAHREQVKLSCNFALSFACVHACMRVYVCMCIQCYKRKRKLNDGISSLLTRFNSDSLSNTPGKWIQYLIRGRISGQLAATKVIITIFYASHENSFASPAIRSDKIWAILFFRNFIAMVYKLLQIFYENEDILTNKRGKNHNTHTLNIWKYTSHSFITLLEFMHSYWLFVVYEYVNKQCH